MGAFRSRYRQFFEDRRIRRMFQVSPDSIFSSKALMWIENDLLFHWMNCRVELSADMNLFVTLGKTRYWLRVMYQIHEWANLEIIIRGNGCINPKVDGMSFEKLVGVTNVRGAVLVSEYLKDFSGLFDYALTIRGLLNGKLICITFFMENDKQVRDFTNALKTSMEKCGLYERVWVQRVEYGAYDSSEDEKVVATTRSQEKGTVLNHWFVRRNLSLRYQKTTDNN